MVKMDCHAKGIMLKLGEMPSGTIISESYLAEMLGTCVETIRRWRRKKELPESINLGNNRVWTNDYILDYLNDRLDHLTREAIKKKKRINSI